MKVLLLIISFVLLSQAQARAQAQPQIEVAVTMDDLPMTEPRTGNLTSLQILHKIIQSYKDASVPVFGFMNGIWLSPAGTDEPETTHLLHAMQSWVKAGFPLSNHTFSHPDFSTKSLRAEEAEILKNEKYLKKAGVDLNQQKWFRYPFLVEGETQEKRDGLRKYLAEKNYRIAEVTIDWDDSSWKDPYTRCVQNKKSDGVEALKKAYLDSAREAVLAADQDAKKLFGRPIKHILLMHVGEFSSLILPSLLKELNSIGVKFIPLEEAESDPIYQLNPNVVSKFGKNFLDQVATTRGLNLTKLKALPSSEYFDTICK